MKIEISEKTYATVMDYLTLVRQDKQNVLSRAEQDGMPGFVRLLESQLRQIEEARKELRRGYHKGRRHE